MSTEKNTHSYPATAKTTYSQSANAALWPGVFILILLANFILPRSWADALNIGLMIIGSVFVVGTTVQVWLARRQAGQVLQNLG